MRLRRTVSASRQAEADGNHTFPAPGVTGQPQGGQAGSLIGASPGVPSEAGRLHDHFVWPRAARS